MIASCQQNKRDGAVVALIAGVKRPRKPVIDLAQGRANALAGSVKGVAAFTVAKRASAAPVGYLRISRAMGGRRPTHALAPFESYGILTTPTSAHRRPRSCVTASR